MDCSSNALLAWGNGSSGRLGHGDTQDQLAPRRVEALAAERVLHVAASYINTLAVASTGTVWTWGGRGVCGHLGLVNPADSRNILPDQLVPRRMRTLAAERVVHVAASDGCALVVTLWSWGRGGSLLGHGDDYGQDVPKRVDAALGLFDE